MSQADSSSAPLPSSPPHGSLVGERPGLLQHHPEPLSPFMPPFSNNMPPVNMHHPNMPLMRMSRPMMPQGPMFADRPPGPMRPMRPMQPQSRFRMPMPGPHEDFPRPREGFPHQGDHWDQGPLQNDWQDYGPNNGPEWGGERPSFRRGGWGPGGPRGRGRFEN